MRSEKSAESHVVCLVDDDPLVLNSLGNLLASDGIAARCFDKAETFLAHIQVHRVELAVLDIRMVGMTGLEVQAHLSSICCQTRVIIITGSERPDDERNAMQAGAIAFSSLALVTLGQGPIRRSATVFYFLSWMPCSNEFG